MGDEGFLHQFWTSDNDHQHAFLLGRGKGNNDSAAYQAGFRFSPDSQWLVRMQKLGAGYHTLFLYRRNGYRFSSAKPLGNMAWDYFFGLLDAKGMHRDRKDPYSISVPPDFADNNAKVIKTAGSEGETPARTNSIWGD